MPQQSTDVKKRIVGKEWKIFNIFSEEKSFAAASELREIMDSFKSILLSSYYLHTLSRHSVKAVENHTASMIYARDVISMYSSNKSVSVSLCAEYISVRGFLYADDEIFGLPFVVYVYVNNLNIIREELEYGCYTIICPLAQFRLTPIRTFPDAVKIALGVTELRDHSWYYE